MKRYPIRDNRSTSKVKPRIFDLVINDNGEKQIEVKDGKHVKTILLADMEEQISEYILDDQDKHIAI